MSNIARDLAKLQPKQEKPAPQPAPPVTPGPILARADGAQDSDQVEQLRANGIMKSTGEARLDHGNDFGGYPVVHPEIGGYIERNWDYGSKSGNLVVDASLANVFLINVTGAITITVDLSKYPKPYGRKGYEYSCVFKIINAGAFAITIPADSWAPYNKAAPTMNKQGRYVIGLTLSVGASGGIYRDAFPSLITV